MKICYVFLIHSLLLLNPQVLAGIDSEKEIIRIHESFDFTLQSLNMEFPGLNISDTETALYFLDLAEAMMSLEPEILLLVDKNNPVPPGYIPGNLILLSTDKQIITNKSGMALMDQAFNALVRMIKSAKNGGITLPVLSAYRSIDYQRKLFDRYRLTYNLNEEEISRFSAPPGMSQHHLGTAVDIGILDNSFADSENGKWLWQHAGEFGWSLSYPRNAEEITGYQWESWHWRWIGREAVLMQGLFFNNSQQGLLEFWHDNAQILDHHYLH